MIIKLPLMLHNIISKQFKISHVPCDVIAFKKEEIPSNILKLIENQYDEKFLEDCDTVLFIKGPIDKKLRKKIFKACDKALGEGANMMNETDFRLLKLHDDNADFGGEDDQTDEEKIDSQVADIVNEPDDNTSKIEDDADDEVEDNGDAVEKSLASESLEDSELNEAKSLDEEDDNDEDGKEDEEEEDSDSEKDDKDDDESEEEEADEEEPVIPTRYVFLKISMKG